MGERSQTCDFDDAIVFETCFNLVINKIFILLVQDIAACCAGRSCNQVADVPDSRPIAAVWSRHHLLPLSPVTHVALAFVLASPCLRASSRRAANAATAEQCATKAAGDRRHFIVLQVPQAATHDSAV